MEEEIELELESDNYLEELELGRKELDIDWEKEEKMYKHYETFGYY